MGLDVSIVPTVVPRRLSAAWHHDGMRVGGRRSVAAAGDIGVAVTGDHNQLALAPPTRSAYQEQVRRIAPPELVGREGELAEHTSRDEARRWLLLALHHGQWTQALPTLLWAEPTAPEQAAAACTDELPADLPTAARTSAQSEN